MGILSRFKDIMASNINALQEKSGDPEKEIEEFMRGLHLDLGKVRSETASVLAEERRAERALADCQAEMSKLQKYAEKCVADGNDEGARKFLEKKAPLQEKEAQLRASHNQSASNVDWMKQMERKLETDIGELELRRTKLKERMLAAQHQKHLNSLGSPTGDGIEAKLKAMEDKANTEYNEAMAIAELRAEKKEDIDELFAQFEKSNRDKK
ncbi:PspA/IM30 family protein [Paenibacillus ginsengarvi]|uniref:PspA/IM30 family protein n=1 Tax=Paenibacillus ginsengarvi TaxID=400777 RepID=A0A3B0CM85_9BACL|nr:PspA/IM30 family protein [Paenibacillus ginsengarvi]RKN86070.1 PspA/IM30 family protein [Paenibacillus ginsengarvi]